MSGDRHLASDAHKKDSDRPTGPIRDRWALLVGANHYVDPAIPPLRFCVNDVLALRQDLQGLGYTVVALHDDAEEDRLLPERDNVEAELVRLCQVVQPDDLLLVHFSCHGRRVDGKPVLLTRRTRMPTLTPALPLAEVERVMRGSKSRRLLLTLDACHAGVDIGRDVTDPEFIRDAYELAEGFALIAASTSEQPAQEWQQREHGVFTYYLLQGLGGQADLHDKGFVTVHDLATFVLANLRRWYIEHPGQLQEPTARTEELGDMIVADYRQAPLRRSFNPFWDRTRINDPARFFDRQQQVRELSQMLTAGNSVCVVGDFQIGKSSLLYYLYLHRKQWFPDAKVAFVNLQLVLDEDDFCAEVLQELGEEGSDLRSLKRALGEGKTILLLDEVEKLAEPAFHPRLHDLLRGLAEEPSLTLAVASHLPLREVFEPRSDTSPFHNIFTEKRLGAFSSRDARALLEHRLKGAGVSFTPEEIDELLQQSGGHPALLQRLAYDLFETKRGG